MFLNRQVTLIFVINFVLNFNLSAQKGQLLIDLKINSKILQKEILYNIYLPVGYDSSVKKYPVLYLLSFIMNQNYNESTTTCIAH